MAVSLSFFFFDGLRNPIICEGERTLRRFANGFGELAIATSFSSFRMEVAFQGSFAEGTS